MSNLFSDNESKRQDTLPPECNMKRKYQPINRELFCSLYDVSEDGRIVSKLSGYEYVQSIDRKGYKILRLPYPDSLNKDKRRPFKVHRIVAMVYLSDYSEKLQVNHKNGIKSDNHVCNLEMVTNQQNALHAWRVLDSTKRKRLIGEMSKSDKKRIKKMVSAATIANRKPISQIDDKGDVLTMFDSLTDATEAMGLKSFSAISHAALNGTKSAGFYWKYL